MFSLVPALTLGLLQATWPRYLNIVHYRVTNYGNTSVQDPYAYMRLNMEKSLQARYTYRAEIQNTEHTARLQVVLKNSTTRRMTESRDPLLGGTTSCTLDQDFPISRKHHPAPQHVTCVSRMEGLCCKSLTSRAPMSAHTPQIPNFL